MNFVTVVKTANSCNKVWDGKKMSFSRPFTQAAGYTQRIDSVGDLHSLIKRMSDKTDCVLIPGGYFPQYAKHKQQFNIMAATEMKRRGVVDVAGVKSIGGNDYIARLKSNMKPSNVILWDYDQADGMPKEWLDKTPDELVLFMRSILGEKVGFVAVESTSARCEGLDKGKGCHLYCLVEDAADLERFKTAWMAQGFAHGWSFLKPTHCRKDIPARGLKAGNICAHVPWGVFDPSVLASCERLDFIGKPDGQGVIKVLPAKIVLYDGIPADTTTVKSLNDEQHKQVKETLKKAGISLTSNDGFNTSVIGGISLSDSLETEIGDITIGEFISGHHEKLRCQIPSHIRDSSSWNGILRMTDKGTALLYDQGTRTSYFLPDSEVAITEKKEWPKLYSLERPKLNTPPITSDCLPPLMYSLADSISKAAKTSPTFALPPMVGAVVSAMRGQINVAEEGGVAENLATVNTANISGRGAGKTACKNALETPKLREYIKNRELEHRAKIRAWRIMMEQADKAAQGADSMLAATQLALVCEKLKDEKPLGHILQACSPTPEALIEAAGNYGFISISTDEGSFLFDNLGRYSSNKSADMNVYLCGFDGGRVSAERRNGGNYGGDIKIGIDVSIQPSVADQLFADGVADGRGLTDRFIWLASEYEYGQNDFHDVNTIDKALLNQWDERLVTLTKEVDALESPLTIRLSHDATLLVRDYGNEINEMVRNGHLEGLEALYDKRGSAITRRLAAVFHCFQSGVNGSISEAEIEQAIAFSRVIMAHRVAIHNTYRGNALMDTARRVMSKIEDAHITSLTMRELYRHHWRGCATKSEAKSVCEYLEDSGWIKIVQPTGNDGSNNSPTIVFRPNVSVKKKLSRNIVVRVPAVPQVPDIPEKAVFEGKSTPLGTAGTCGTRTTIILQPKSNEDLQHTTIAPAPKFVEVF